ncbi:MAG: OmpA family protein [Elusimicrobia bacterium]|nr:OmpA family protein [Elusimicrobiota bacterium]
MRRSAEILLIPVLLAGCAGGKLKTLQAKADLCELNADELRQQVRGGADLAETLQSRIKELEGQGADLDSRLKAQQERIESLDKSNQQLRSAIEADKGELSGQIAAVVKEKDDLARALDTAKKDKTAAQRERANMRAARDKLANELSFLRPELEALKAQAAAAKAEKEKALSERSVRLAKAHEDLGVLADTVLKELQSEKAKLEQEGERVELTLQESLLFKPQQAKPTDEGLALLDRVGRSLQSLTPRAVRVEGHSDNSAIKWELFGSFTSHWDLALARATAVARYLHEHSGLDPRKLTASSFGEFRPIKGNDTPEGREANRRVVLVVEPAGSQP